MTLTLQQAETIADTCIKTAADKGFNPLTVVVFDGTGTLRVVKTPDGTPPMRPNVAMGKAWGAYSMGMPSRMLAERFSNNPGMVSALLEIAGGKMVPVTGAVLIKDKDGNVVGAAGASGDQSHRDEFCVIAGVKAAGLVPVPEEGQDG